MVFLYPALASSIVRAKQAQLGPLDGRGFETPRVQNTLLPNPSEGSAPSLRAAASESASCRRLGVTQAACPRAARRTSLAYASLLPNPNPNPNPNPSPNPTQVCCIGLRVLQRRSKGYNKAPLAGRSFDDPEDDDADEEEERHDASMAGSPLTRRS